MNIRERLKRLERDAGMGQTSVIVVIQEADLPNLNVTQGLPYSVADPRSGRSVIPFYILSDFPEPTAH